MSRHRSPSRPVLALDGNRHVRTCPSMHERVEFGEWSSWPGPARRRSSRGASPGCDRDLEHFLEFGRDEDARRARPRPRRQMISKICCLACTSMPRLGSSKNITFGAVLSQLPMTIFCWLPPESDDTGSMRAAGLDLQIARSAGRRRAPRGSRVMKPPGAIARGSRGRGCRGSTASERARPPCGSRACSRARVASSISGCGAALRPPTSMVPCVCGIGAEYGAHHLGPPGPEQAGNAEDLAAMKFEGHVFEVPRRASVP